MQREDIEAIAQLSPMQRGLLFHALYEPEADAYITQFDLELQSSVDTAALQQAWQWLIARHAVLRTSFHWESLDAPLQVVRKRVESAVTIHDWTAGAQSDELSRARLDRLRSAERERGFDLSRAPAARLALVRLGESRAHLLLTNHHIILDGWSTGLLAHELFAAYDAFAAGRPPAVPATPPFRHYVAWLQKQDRDAATHYWRARLSGLDEPTHLALDDAPALAGVVGDAAAATHGRVRMELSENESSSLLAFAQRHALTLNAVFEAAWALLLRRYTGRDDVVFGTVSSGRPAELPGVEAMVGLFINTLPLRVTIDPDETVVTLLQRVQRTSAAMRAFEYLPLADLQRLSAVPSGTPLFDTLFVFENYPLERSLDRLSPGLRIGHVEVHERTNYPLTISSGPGERLLFDATYARAVYAPDTVTRLLEHLRGLLLAMIDAPASPVAQLAMVGTDEARRLLVDHNRTSRDFGAPVPVHQLFEAQVVRTPGALAATVAMQDGGITYAALNGWANAIQERLTHDGIGRGAIVPVRLAESPAFAAAILGVLKAGAAFCPVDPRVPDERLSAILDELGCAVMLTGSASPINVERSSLTVIAVDALGGIAPASVDASPCAVSAGDPIYAIYTSGSTGTPKAVVVPHRGIYNRLRWMDEVFTPRAASAVLQTTRNVFDSAVWQILWPLVNGGTTISIASEDVADAAAIAAAVGWHAITTIDFVPSVLDVLVTGLNSGADGDAPLASLQVAIVGGEAITPRTTHLFRHTCPHIRVFNVYGPTEASIGCIFHEVTGADGERIPIGRPIANVRAYVLDQWCQPVPYGIPGELCLAGECLALGYLDDSDRTNESFVTRDLPLAGRERLYRTGDRVRMRATGEIDFLGRSDQQIKIRGLRIEPREIEMALERCPEVARALVVATGTAGGDRRLLAYVQPADGAKVDDAALKQELRARLPEALIPSAIVVVAAFPVGPGGKLDRRALPAPSETILSAAHAAPFSPLEEIVAAAWNAVLGVPPRSREDDFFSLGGHSLRATQLIARLRDAFAVDLPIRLVFDVPALGAMAERIGELRRQQSGVTLPALVPQTRPPVLPLSFAQQRLWFLDRLERDNAAYNMPHALRLEGSLDRRALARALQALLDRHEALRTWFTDVEGKPAQIIEAAVASEIPTIDLRELPDDARWPALMRFASAEAARPFQLDRAPLLRVTLAHLGARDRVLLLTLHHILSDGWSMGVLTRDLCALYSAYASGSRVSLPDLPIQYADFTLWQQQWLTGGVLAAQLDYWRCTLGTSPPPLELPLDFPRPARQTYRGAGVRFVLPPDLRAGLLALAHRHGCTLFMALLAAWEVLLSRYAGQEDFCIGSPIANRHARGTEDLIGFFVNMLVLRADLTGDPTFVEHLRRVRQRCLDAYAHQDLPFEKLVEELQPIRDAARNPVFQVIFALQNTPTAAVALRDLSIAPLPVAVQHTRFDLELHASDDGQQLDCLLVYNADLFTAETISQMAASLRTCLDSALHSPSQAISQLALLSAAEARAAVATLRGRGARQDGLLRDGICQDGAENLYDVFAVHAEARAGDVAIRFGQRAASYGNLARDVQRLAQALVAEGVRPEARVGLYFERSEELIAAMLAILAAGAAYVPLDPDYPDERLAYIIDDARVELVLTADGVCRYGAGKSRVLGLRDLYTRAETAGAVSATPPRSRAHAACVIYTSGSTGQPKGTIVTHGNVLRLFEQTHAWFGFGASDVWMLFHSFAFDFSIWEIWGALLYGGTLVVFPAVVARAPLAFYELLQRHGTTVLNQTPSAFYQLLRTIEEHGLAPLPALRLVIFGGEALDPGRLQPWLTRYGAERPALVNMYGITETTVHVTYAPIAPADADRPRSPIGRPIPDLDLFLLDRHQQPVAPGMLGEIYVGGPGLARGYLDRPALTATRFVPNPFASQPGERLYRSGDLARLHPDGTLEFRGRADQQVKVRGYRIELQEIAAQVRAHPLVQETAIIARGSDRLGTEIIAYVVPRALPDDRLATDSQVTDEWKAVFDLTYRREAGLFAPTLNLAGWRDSYTGEAIPPNEMAEWVDATVSKIAALRPRRVLEVGCGTGLLLHRLAPACASYVGTDYSLEALDQVRPHVASMPQVRLLHRPAHVLDGFIPGSFDTIILNSVAQYFPSAEYLTRVIDGLFPLLAPGGTLFIGDVRHLHLAEALHASRVAANAATTPSDDERQRLVREAVAAEEELLIAPAFFTRFAADGAAALVNVTLKRGRAHNELTRYRYDVALHLPPITPVVQPEAEWDWRRDRLDTSTMLQRLQHVTAVRIHDIPNARLTPAEGAAHGAVDPEELCTLAEQLGFHTAIGFARDAVDRVDIVMMRAEGLLAVGHPENAGPASGAVTNRPRDAWAARRLAPALRAHLRGRLPEYMVPAQFVLLDALPLTTNGKLDRRRLPEPAARRALDAGFVAPVSPAEQVVARVWSDLLGLDRVGLHDRFLDIGGHSLIAVQAVSRLTAVFQTDVPLQFILDNPSVAAMVDRLAELWQGRDVVEEIARTLLEIEQTDRVPEGAPAA